MIEQTKFASKHPLVKLAIKSYKRDLRDMIESVKPYCVLDVGCGEGIISSFILSQFSPKIRMVGVDLE